MGNALTKEDRALLERPARCSRKQLCAWLRWRGSTCRNDGTGCQEIHLGNDQRPGSILRPGDMGCARVHAGPFVVGAKMAAKMPQARTSRRQKERCSVSNQRTTKGVPRLGCG